ncbi:SIR2 family protein [Ensifer sp. 22521]|uniref:SIR2 family protein n=1 Tax=Ensifer sp. 22521 TaxID=3453935 RepID=UPI003F8660C3
MKPKVKQFVERYLKEIVEGNAAVFAGAGLSAPAGFVNWQELLRPIAEELDLNADIETDFVALAQFHRNKHLGNKGQQNQLLIDRFGVPKSPTANHEVLAKLPIETYWTTNYDDLIEKSLAMQGKTPDVKYTEAHLALTRRGRDAVVYKMHGDISNPQDAVLAKDDYERYHVNRAAFVTALSGDLVSRTFVFLGFSFTDPNLDYILSRVRLNLEENQRKHYCFFKKRVKFPNETEEAFKNAVVRQELAIADLLRFNIEAVLVDEYAEIDEALQLLHRLYRSKSVFISGSADLFDPWGRAKVDIFSHTLGSQLAKHGYRVVTGLGKGVGDAVLSGVVDQVYRSSKNQLDDALLVRPFPQQIDAANRQAVWKRYREELIGQAGIAIFLLGNKSNGSGNVIADGMKEEFQIAAAEKLLIIAMGTSGHAAKEIFDQIAANPEAYFSELSDQAKYTVLQLGTLDAEPDVMVSEIMNAIAVSIKK